MLNKQDKERNPFSIPPNYFEGINEQIMNRLPQKEKPSSKVISLWRKVLPWSAVAAMLAILVSVGVNISKPAQTVATLQQNAQSQTQVTVSSSDDFYGFIEDESVKGAYNEAINVDQ